MNSVFLISTDWESLDEGEPDERACFSALGIRANNQWLTEGRDAIANRLRQSPLLSASHLAEWISWNWWRLRWEPRSLAEGWSFAHKTSNIGGGYIWPNITIFSDGERTALISRPTHEREDTPFRYISNVAAVIPSHDFEQSIDEFLNQVINRLEDQGVRGTNLQSLWADVCSERSDPTLTRYRKLEAMLGMEPDDAGDALIETLISEGKLVGEGAVNELAANRWNTRKLTIPSISDLSEISTNYGFSYSPENMVKLSCSPNEFSWSSAIPAWRVGERAAKLLRKQERLAEEPIRDEQLAQLIAVDKAVLSSDAYSPNGMSYAFDLSDGRSQIVLRSRYDDGRRFELARLLGDRLLTSEGALFPSTRAYTYRQKVQRSFAAELLSPFDDIINLLQGNYSYENMHDVAEHFGVSDMTIRTQLVNHKVLEREDLDPDTFALAA